MQNFKFMIFNIQDILNSLIFKLNFYIRIIYNKKLKTTFNLSFEWKIKKTTYKLLASNLAKKETYKIFKKIVQRIPTKVKRPACLHYKTIKTRN